MEERPFQEIARDAYKSRMVEIRALWKLNCKDPEKYHDEYGRWDEYGLSLDYVEPGTFRDQRRGYLRFQISWGGPSEEFRFFLDERLNCTSIEFWYLDWFKGHRIRCRSKLMREIFEDWNDCDIVKPLIEQASAA